MNDVLDLTDLIRQFLAQAGGRWFGTAADLLRELGSFCRTQGRDPSLPSTPNQLGRSLREITDDLAAAGIELKFRRTATARLIQLSGPLPENLPETQPAQEAGFVSLTERELDEIGAEARRRLQRQRIEYETRRRPLGPPWRAPRHKW